MSLTWLIGVLVFILQIVAIVKTWQSGESNGAKVVWTIVLLLLPLLGLILWFFLGPRR